MRLLKFLSLSLLLVAPAFADAPHTGDLALDSAMRLEKLGQYELAASDVETFLKTRPAAAQFHQASLAGTCARILAEGGRYPGAIKCLNSYVSFQSGHATAFALRAMCFALSGKTMEAANDLATAMRLKIYPRDLAKPGVCCRQSTVDICRIRARDALRKKPGDSKALFALALIDCVDSRFSQGTVGATSALKASPGSYEALIVRALAGLASGQKKEAFGDINKALEMRPDNALAYRVLESYYIAVSGIDSLMADLRRRESNRLNDFCILMAEARVCKLSRNLEKERAIYDHILALNPKFAPALFARGELSQETEDVRQAITYFSRGLSVDSDNAPALKQRAACYMSIKDYSRALSDLNRLIQLNDDSGAYPARNECLRQLHR